MKKLPLLGVLIGLTVGAFSFSYADIVAQQPLSDTQITTYNTTIWGIGTNITANNGIDSIGFSMRQTIASGYTFRIRVYCRTGSSYGSSVCPEHSNIAMYTQTFTPSTGTTTYAIPLQEGLGIAISPSRYYFLFWEYVSGSGGTGVLAGTNTIDGHANGAAPTPDPSMPQYYLVGAGTNASNATTSRIVSQLYPSNGTTTYNSNDILFQATWYNNSSVAPEYDFVQFEVSDVTNGTQYNPVQTEILSSGYGTTTQYWDLTAGHMHIWRACLYDDDLGQKTCGAYNSFNVVSASAPQSLLPIPDIDDSNASSSLSQYLTQFVNIPNLLATKYPFSYFYDIGTLLIELQSTTTQNWPEARFDYDSLDISTTSKNALPASFVLFSSTTVTEYIPENVLAAFRALMAGVLWFSFAYMVFRRTSVAFH